ncbi:hypothetical protein ACA910_007911 [Epithemia clementina (nom. ined.)]
MASLPTSSESGTGIRDGGMDAACRFLSPEELEQINRALNDNADGEDNAITQVGADVGTGFLEEATDLSKNEDSHTPSIEGGMGVSGLQGVGISNEEALAIERAIAEADAAEEARSLKLALQMQEEEKRWHQERIQSQRVASARSSKQGNVRTMTRAELKAEEAASLGAYGIDSSDSFSQDRIDREISSHQDADAFIEDVELPAGFRMNSIAPHRWSRLDQHMIVGPNNEVRTKHDASLDSQANIHRLGLDDEGFTSVGNRTFNSFRQSMKRKTKKGVATHGTGRAGTDSDGTKGGALDAASFDQITRAINAGWINKLNGVVKEGKEAVIYHADAGAQSDGLDVAVKLFKRIQEFRNRGEYVDGDPRFDGSSFRNSSKRQQLALWTEKEFRNLMRANRAGVPVPMPLMYKENMLCMRFMGLEGWPAPQLREVNLRKGSKKWKLLYDQILSALRSLYIGANLVHGDLSEYNIMVVPAHLVDNTDKSIDNPNSEVQAVLIDFGQAVGSRHPNALLLLRRDIDRVTSFFSRYEVEAMTPTDAFNYVTKSSIDSTAVGNY